MEAVYLLNRVRTLGNEQESDLIPLVTNILESGKERVAGEGRVIRCRGRYLFSLTAFWVWVCRAVYWAAIKTGLIFVFS